LKHRTIRNLAVAAGLLATAGAAAQELPRPDSHAPIGVMGDHYHEKGEFMFSYRYMNMDMGDNALGSSDISPDAIATTIPNRFFGMAGQPPTLRVVPVRMSMEMHMLGFMYAPSDRVTIMAMTSEVTKEMDHVTYMGGAGTTVLGGFRTSASGIGDTSLSALISVYEGDRSRLHINAGISVPTGSTDETGAVLAPTGATPTLRLPYPMQLGSGSYDFLPGVTWASFFSDRASFGLQWRAAIRFSDNDEGYHLGDEHRLTAWYSRTFSEHLSGSARLEWFDRANMDGIDPSIVAPVQTADPARQGATRTDFALGLNFVAAGGHRVAIEYSMPIDQDLDGPQLKTDDQIVLGYQFSF
jgi:hypothetical protein